MHPIFAIFVSVNVAVFLGSLWYSPVLFGNIWVRLTFPGKRPEDIKPDNMMGLFLVSTVGHSVVMMVVHHIFRYV